MSISAVLELLVLAGSDDFPVRIASTIALAFETPFLPLAAGRELFYRQHLCQFGRDLVLVKG
jgi:hypothetical protein